MRRIRIAAASVMVAAGLIGAVAAPASAAKPSSQACVGQSLSPLAANQPAPGAFGAAVGALAQAPDGQAGLGNAIQALQAGDIPDAVVPNTCN